MSSDWNHGDGEPPRPEKTNGLAIASLVCGIAGIVIFPLFCILALVLGYRARSQIDAAAGAQGGRRLAMAGIVLGWIAAALIAVSVILFVAVPGD